MKETNTVISFIIHQLETDPIYKNYHFINRKEYLNHYKSDPDYVLDIVQRTNKNKHDLYMDAMSFMIKLRSIISDEVMNIYKENDKVDIFSKSIMDTILQNVNNTIKGECGLNDSFILR